MQYKNNWEETKQRFEAWWNCEKMDRPLLRLVVKREEPVEALEGVVNPLTPKELHLDVDRIVKQYRNYYRTHELWAEAFPAIDLNIGPGSMALYLGSEPNFAWDTVWFKESVDDWGIRGELKYDAENYWWKRHVEMINRGQALSKGELLVNIPDIIENVDILAAMRGPQDFCYDLIDEPELMKKYIEQIDELYFRYYDTMYEMVKGEDGSSSFTAFHIWGMGKVAKVQCDFCALMSPAQFREFIQPSLRKQCSRLDHSLYHLDGPDAIKHLDALMEIEELDALQWTPGAGKPDGLNEGWYPIYDKVRAAGKALWIPIADGDFTRWIDGAERLLNRYGKSGIYLLFPDVEKWQADEILRKFSK